MRAVDSNVVVRLLMRDDAKQALAAERCIANGAWVSLLALAEAVWVMSTVYGLKPVQTAASIEMLTSHRDLTLQDPDVVAAALEHFKRKPALGFSDCLLLEIARKAGHLPFGTFDRELSKLDAAEKL